MKNLRRNFERFCYKNRNIGIPNLMLYISLGTAVVYLYTLFTKDTTIYSLLCFDRGMILKGQLWRLVTYVLTSSQSNIFFMLIMLVCYYSLGRAIENLWGTLRFNLFYLTGVVMMDVFCMIFGGMADVYYLNLSLFLSYATMYPDAQFLFLYVIPVKAWIFALIDLAITLYQVAMLTAIGLFPFSLFPLVAIANYLLFFGSDVKNVIPISWRANFRRLFRKRPKVVQGQKSKVAPFPNAGSYEASVATVKAPYNHRCTVCGRTDVSHPDLEFRYCSKCNGYHCYCEEHISNHIHVE